MTSRIIVDCFDSAGHLAGRKRTYKTIKAAVLAAGRYSIFEAMADLKAARMFTRISKDPDVEHYELPFPWIGIRRKVTP